MNLNLGSIQIPINAATKTFAILAKRVLGVRLVRKPTRRDRSRKFCYGFPSPRAMKHMRQKVRETVGRDYRRSLEEQLTLLNPVLRGWANYFNWLNSAQHLHEVERYVIQRLNRWR